MRWGHDGDLLHAAWLMLVVVGLGSVGFGYWQKSLMAGAFAAALLFLIAWIAFSLVVIENRMSREASSISESLQIMRRRLVGSDDDGCP
jgi:hypothetical protein